MKKIRAVGIVSLALSASLLISQFIPGFSFASSAASAAMNQPPKQTLLLTYKGNSDVFKAVTSSAVPTVFGVANGKYYNQNVVITYINGTGTLNGKPFLNGSTVSSNGKYTLVVKGKAKSVTVVFHIDKNPPVVGGVKNNGYYNSARTVTFNKGTATLNGQPIRNGARVSSPGAYTLVVTDQAGNTTTVLFTIDNTPPVVSGVKNSGSYNSDCTVTFDEGTATLNGKPFSSGTSVTAEGHYVLIVTDQAGNRTMVRFTIDKTAPVVYGVQSGGVYSPGVAITFNEGTAVLNGNPFANGATVSAPGTYTLVVTDRAGNQTTVNFTVGESSPIVTGIVNNGFYNTDRTITFDSGAATLNGASFTSGSTVSAEGVYTLVITYGENLSETYTFTIDKTAPSVAGVANNGIYNTDVAPSFNEGAATLNGKPFLSGASVSASGLYHLLVTDQAGNRTAVTFTIDKVPPVVYGVANNGYYNTSRRITFTEGTGTLNGQPFANGSMVSAEGAYTLVVTDQAGNVTTVAFTIDKTAPVVSGVVSGKAYNAPVTVTFSDGTATLNGTAFASGTTVSAEGSYTLIVRDKAGNTATVQFVIDKTAPVVTGVKNNTTYTHGVSISFNEGTAALNGKVFANGTEVSQNGSYTLVVTDAAGNSTTVAFTIKIDTSYMAQTGISGLTVYEYGKSLLNAQDQQYYDQIANAVRNMQGSVWIPTAESTAEMEKVAVYYLDDHSEIFYFDTLRLERSGGAPNFTYTLDFSYSYTPAQVNSMRGEMATDAQNLLSSADGKSTDLSKERALHDALINNCSYDLNIINDEYADPQSHSAYSALVDQTAVCDGYARTMQLLLNTEGIKALVVDGTADGGGHAWNMVQVGGTWYYLDATWDDPVSIDDNGNYYNPNVLLHTYFNFTSDPDHDLGSFDESDPFSEDSENYEIMPVIG